MGIGLNELVFASFKQTARHGGDQWWLYVSTCLACRQSWMVAQDERIYDNFYLRRLTASVVKEIEAFDLWPEEFLTYERVLALGKATGISWRFDDPQCPALVDTAEDLRRERPDITVEEIANLLAIPAHQAARLLV
ncbi:hypothetical protein [Novosphingobium sp. Gsoil 351]|uniref:hypothetical protein n=1 Tax=Novosphingobium sp. Gsoil 351 TaxID=2675225 RepID=UPI0012B4DDA5|nr:hypothetical protein [Novosphingobium sp. Gsoil 351]QGN55608.1 hypothetical protein GKE62_14720 [Novosphingobium sp. Gsoil 351]